MEFQHYRYGNPLFHVHKREDEHDDEFGLRHKKIFKVKARPKLIYHIELYYYEHFCFIKFYPKIFEGDPDKYKKVGMDLTIGECRKLLNTCCDIIGKELQKSEDYIYSFIAQVYDKDNELNRLISKRYSWYLKQVSTYFRNTEEYLRFSNEPFNFYCLAKIDEGLFINRLQTLINKLVKDVDLSNQFMTDERKRQVISIQESKRTRI